MANGKWQMAGVLGLCASIAIGADLSDVSVEIEGWTLHAITDVAAVTHLIATRNDDEIRSTDIDVVLYEREIDGWTATAYEPSVTLEDALLDLADEFELPDPFSSAWMVNVDTDDILEHVLPRLAFGNGVFAADPLEAVINLSNAPETIVEGAEEAGHPAAGSSVNTGRTQPTGPTNPGNGTEHPCGGLRIQDFIADTIDLHIATPMSAVDGGMAMHNAIRAVFPFCCAPFSWTVTGPTPGPWNCCGPWLLTGSTDHGTCGIKCHYKRAMCRTITRHRFHMNRDCTSCFWNQTRLEFGNITTSDLHSLEDYNCNSALYTCSPTPGTGEPPCGAPNSVSRTGWAPGPLC